MPSQERPFPNRDIGSVSQPGTIRQFRPRGTGEAVLLQTRLECSAVAGLLEDAIQHAAAKLRGEETAEPALDRYIQCEPAMPRAILRTRLRFEFRQTLRTRRGVALDPVRYFHG